MSNTSVYRRVLFWIGACFAAFFFIRWLQKPAREEAVLVLEDKSVPTSTRKEKRTESTSSEPEMKKVPSPAKEDDLKSISGIGPKTEAALKNAGITTYKQLAALKTQKIKDILQEAGVRVTNVETWPEQAKQLLANK